MKTKTFIIGLVSLSLGILIGHFITSKMFRVIPPQEIDIKQSGIYYQNHYIGMNYNEEDLFHGYFDLNKKSVELINSAMDSKNYSKCRVYFGQDQSSNPQRQYLILNGFDSKGIEMNTGKMFLIPNAINISTDCPKYCDFNKTLLSGFQ